MRFLISTLAVLALASTINAKLMTASVGPITENPIPVWGKPATDACNTVGSCDACQPAGAQYCYYKDSGDATCCKGNKPAGGAEDVDVNTEDESATLVASVGPITENPIPVWGKPASDSCATVGSCDACQPGGVQYCYYKDSGDATCCQGTKPFGSDDGDNERAAPADDGTLVASVGPITENPVPRWGKPLSDSCSTVGSCDACQPGGTQYCYYKDSGDATCCQGTPDDESASSSSSSSMTASVGPIEEDPIPAWARPDDACTRKRSCDMCATGGVSNIAANQYCKYTESGIPMCCTGKQQQAAVDAPVDAEAQQMDP